MNRTLFFWAIGAIIQGLLLGIGVFLAILQLVIASGGATAFRYQGF